MKYKYIDKSLAPTSPEKYWLKQELTKEQKFVCLDSKVYRKAKLVELEFANEVKAEIIKGYR